MTRRESSHRQGLNLEFDQSIRYCVPFFPVSCLTGLHIHSSYLKALIALAGVAQWTECQKGHQFDSHSGHVPGLQARSPQGVREKQPHVDVSLPLSKNKQKPFF